MENIFITELNIRKVRHLIDINIPLSRENRKNLILTGKNGSGKTSVLKTFAEHLEYIVADDFYTEAEAEKNLLYFQKLIDENSGTEVVLQGEKDKYETNVVNCCTDDPETLIHQELCEGKVCVTAVVDTPEAKTTASLVEDCFELRNQAIREKECQVKVRAL